MTIFSKKGKIMPSDSKTNIRLSFDMPIGVSRAVVKYSYSPKDVEDEQLAGELIADGMRRYYIDGASISSFMPVRNLITLSFDELGNYRGACHRHPNEQTIVIAKEGSTPGIINRTIISGSWDIVINVHYAGCEVDYNIEVEVE